MKIFCFGNLGYVGTVVTNHFVGKVKTYIGFDTGYFENCLIKKTKNIRNQIYGDVRKTKKFNFENFDSVIYLAALSNDPMGDEFKDITQKVNFNSAVNVAIQAKKKGVKRFVYASSCSIYGKAGDFEKKECSSLNPLTSYAKSKIDTEKELSKIASDTFMVTCLRFSTACGYSDRLRLDLVLNDFVSSVFLNNEIRLLSDGQSWRPLIHVNDMARAIEWASSRTKDQGGNFLSINVGSKNWNYKVIDLAKISSKVLGNVPVKFSEQSFNDPRSYKVNFELFETLAPNHQPVENVEDTILKIAQSIKKKKKISKNHFVRLQYLKKLIFEKKLSKDLYWV